MGGTWEVALLTNSQVMPMIVLVLGTIVREPGSMGGVSLEGKNSNSNSWSLFYSLKLFAQDHKLFQIYAKRNRYLHQ